MPDTGTSTTHHRWSICALLFFAATINYMDRQVIGLLKPVLQTQLGWSEIGYSNIVLAFQLAYAVGLLVMGRVVDWLGTRKGFSLAVLIWSAAAMAHAAARSVLQFAMVRFALGLGESGNFPASIKTIAEWFPKKERALATGLFNSGTNIGAIVTPLIIPWITYRFGWQMAFIGTGALGLIWVIAWWTLYRPPRRTATYPRQNLRTSGAIRRKRNRSRFPLREIVEHRQAWAIAAGRFFTDPVWYIYLFWVPDFLSRRFGLDLRAMAVPLFVIYTGATVGSISGGWLSSSLLRHGWTLNKSRKTALLVSASGGSSSGVRRLDNESVDSPWRWWRSLRVPIKGGRPTCTRWRPTCFRERRLAAWWDLPAWPVPSAPCSPRKPWDTSCSGLDRTCRSS